MIDPAHASTQGSIVLSGTVQQNCNITVTATPAAGSLTLTGTGTSTVNVGSVVETCNDFKGYKITVASTNNASQSGSNFDGILKGATTNTDTVTYTVAYGVSTSLVPTSGTAETVSGKNIAGTTNSVFVAFTGNTSLGADTYTDTLTLTMVTN
jgi:hypothetical protein